MSLIHTENVIFRLLLQLRDLCPVALVLTVCISSIQVRAQDTHLHQDETSKDSIKENDQTSDASHRPDAITDEQMSRLRSKYGVSPWSLGYRGRSVHAPRFGQGREKSFERTFSDLLDYESSKNSLLNIDVTRKPENLRGNIVFNLRNPSEFSGSGGVTFDIDGAKFKADSLEANPEKGLFRVDGKVEMFTLDSKLTADNFSLEIVPGAKITEKDKIRYRLLPHGYNPYAVSKLGDGVLETYNLEFTERKRAFRADYIQYDSVLHQGVLTHVKGYVDPFYFNADRINVLGPGTFEVENIWLTTCDEEDPHYRIRFSNARVEEGKLVMGKKTKLQVGKRMRTFFYIPKISGVSFTGEERLRLELEAGQRSQLGYYLNVAQWYTITPNIDLAYRVYPTTTEGQGIGFDGEYDYRQNPASHLFGSKGEFETLYTTRKRGFTQWYHRQKLSDDLTLLGQWEQWYDKDFVKDFYNDEYEDRTGPRTFANLTYLREDYIVTGTTSKATHNFTRETEKLPEATLHIMERHIGEGFYLTMDSVAGQYRHVPTDIRAQRYSQVARLSYDMNLMRGFNLVPFVEGSATHYKDTVQSDTSDTRVSGLAGLTAQTRFQRSYSGHGKFLGFKHIILPSVTYLSENSSSLKENDIPRFDTIDNRPSRDRIESKIDNVVFGRNLENDRVWRVARLTLYQGNDLENDIAKTSDYEVDMELRPRPWWGFRTFAERHEVENDDETIDQDFDRVLSYIFYDDQNFENSFNARLGYSLTELDDDRQFRDILYGVGYKFSEKWSVSADHTYDLDRETIRRQSYQIRRRLHKWSMGLNVRDRPSGTDINFVMSLIGFSGTNVSF